MNKTSFPLTYVHRMEFRRRACICIHCIINNIGTENLYGKHNTELRTTLGTKLFVRVPDIHIRFASFSFPKRESFFACIVVHLLLGNLTAIPTWLRVSHLKRNYSPQSPREEQSESPEPLDFTDYVHSHQEVYNYIMLLLCGYVLDWLVNLDTDNCLK